MSNPDQATAVTALKCPQCKAHVIWDERFPFRPFCSQRCQLIDLGAWAGEEHRIPEEAGSDIWSDTHKERE